MPDRRLSPIGAVVRGVLAGAAGTAAMDLVWYGRYRRGGGHQAFAEWEFSSDVTWDTAPAPAHVGKRLTEGFLQRPLPEDAAPLVNNVMHWAYGLGWAAAYGIVAGSMRRPKLGWGVFFATIVWGSGYVVLPLAKLYKPIWEYDLPTLAKDYSAHLAYGTTTAAAFRVLSLLAKR